MASWRKTKCHVTIISMNLWNMPTTMSPHHYYLVCLLWWREQQTQVVACCPLGSSPFLGNLQFTPGEEHVSILAQWKEGHPCLGFRLHLVLNMLNGVCVWAPTWPVHELHILLCRKCIRVTCCVVGGIVVEIHAPKVPSKHTHHLRKHTIAEKPNVALAVEGSIQHHQFTPLTMVNGTPYHDWGMMVTVRGLDARIYQSLPLPVTHTSTVTTLKQH